MDLVSVIIPVGPKHVDLVTEAVRSVELQNYPDHEIIIVNNSGQALPTFPHTTLAAARNNISLARNVGLNAAAGRFVLWLDADDLLPPDALRILTDAYHAFDGSYVYGDWYNVYQDGSASYGSALTREKLLLGGIHPISALVPTELARAVGGFDEAYASRWEDWEFWLRMAAHGHCGERVPQATLLYRRWTGTSYITAVGEGDKLIQELQAKYRPYLTGDTAMACCGKKSGGAAQAKGAITMGINDKPPTVPGSGVVIMEYTGPQRGSRTRRVNGNAYAFGANNRNRYAEVQAADVQSLLVYGDLRVVPRIQAVDVGTVLASVKEPAQPPKPIDPEIPLEHPLPPPVPADEIEFDPNAIPPPPDPERLAQMKKSLEGHVQSALENKAVRPVASVQAIKPKGRNG